MGVNNAQVFYNAAGHRFDRWQKAIGYSITHKVLGQGTIAELIPDPTGFAVEFVIIDFKEGRKRYRPQHIADPTYFVNMIIPSDLNGLESSRKQLEKEFEERELRRIEDERIKAEEQKQREEEIEARKEFEELKVKYLAGHFSSDLLISPLYKILLQMESTDILDKDQLDWLDAQRLFGTLAIYYEYRFRQSPRCWDVVMASKNWRKYGNPERAIAVTSNLVDKSNVLSPKTLSGEANCKAALFTTRGAALLDMNMILEAEQCACKALQYRESHYPYNLLGKLYYQTGNPEQGDTHFSKAQSLGATATDQEKDIEWAIKNAGRDQRIRVIDYLLQKDPNRYGWARKYLPKS